MKKISLNEVPLYSSLVEDLLYSDETKKRYKTKQEVLREYQHEKWSTFLGYVGDNFRFYMFRVCYIGSDFLLASISAKSVLRNEASRGLLRPRQSV